MIKKVEASSPGTNEEDLQYILDNIDVDNYFDYMAFEMFFGNSDPGNIRFYKLDGEGQKWKWIFYDADYGLFNSGFDSPTSYLKESGAGQQKINNTLIRKLLENEEMLHKFLTRLGEIYQVFTTDFMTELFRRNGRNAGAGNGAALCALGRGKRQEHQHGFAHHAGRRDAVLEHPSGLHAQRAEKASRPISMKWCRKNGSLAMIRCSSTLVRSRELPPDAIRD